MPETDFGKTKDLLTNKRFSAIKSLIGHKHAIDMILLLYLGKARHGEAEIFMQDLKLQLSDGAYYARMKELVGQGLAKGIAIDSHKKYYVKTEKGDKVARLILKFFRKIE